MGKLAVFFPGIGYTADKPLLHYSRRLAEERGYEIQLLPYSGFPRKVRGDRKKMAECYRIALRQAGEMLADTDMPSCEDILFIGKSIGTIIAARFAAKSAVRERIRLVLYTPLEDTFHYSFGDAVVFTGTDDPWVGKSAGVIPELCRKEAIPCFVIPGGNHSLESGRCLEDLHALSRIMEDTGRFMDRALPLRTDEPTVYDISDLRSPRETTR